MQNNKVHLMRKCVDIYARVEVVLRLQSEQATTNNIICFRASSLYFGTAPLIVAVPTDINIIRICRTKVSYHENQTELPRRMVRPVLDANLRPGQHLVWEDTDCVLGI